MKKSRIILGILAVVLAAMAGAPVARAGSINGPAMAGLLISNTAPVLDYYGLTLFEGESMTDVLNTGSIATLTGFSQILSGTYLGQALSVAYVGNSTAFPGGAITWNSVGAYGNQAWSSSGSATFTFPAASTFQIAYSSSLTIGSDTMSTDLTISGAASDHSLFYTGTTGTITVDRKPVPAPKATILEPEWPEPGDPDEHDLETNGGMLVWGTTVVIDADYSSSPREPTLIEDKGIIGETCPEPSSLLLAAFGVLGLFIALAPGRRRRNPLIASGSTRPRTNPL